eukprot:INCI18218.1.p1 GENE.INCI18218.1~~INCI18218.1.p1  ORF type:complete len:725 (+),score=205.11 INCI18218.1:117-2291(+)
MSSENIAAAAEQQAPAAKLVTAESAADKKTAAGEEGAESESRSCRDLLNTASQWYSAAKEYVPDVAKPLVAKVESKVGQKLEEYPDAVQRVEAFVDSKVIPAAEAAAAKTQKVLANENVQSHVIVPGRAAVKHVVEKTNELLASDRGQALRAKATDAVNAMNTKASALRSQIDQTYTRAVEVGLDAAGRVHDAASKAKDFEQAAATFIKEKWRAPPSRSDIHASAVALANIVDGLVERNLPEEEGAEPADASSATDVDDTVDSDTPATGSSTADNATPAQQEQGSDAVDSPAAAAESQKLSDQSIASLARNIAGKVSFRMKKRFVKQLEAAKGNLKLRTTKLLHSTNLIQYAQSIAADDRYAKLSTVLAEAAQVAQSAPGAVVRTFQEKVHNANVTGVEVFQRGEESARLAIVTTGKITEKCLTYANALAARIRERIQELEAQRAKKTDNSSTEQPSPGDEEQETKDDDASGDATPVPLAAALGDYVRATADTGAATMFVFRDELNQVLTHAFSASKPRIESARAAVQEAVVNPAWTAITQWKDRAAAGRAEVASVIEDARAKGAAAVQQATTWTNLAFNEFASTVPVARGVHALPAGFAAGLQYVLQRMAQRRSSAAADATGTDEAVPVEADVVDAVVVAPTLPDAATNSTSASEPEAAADSETAEATDDDDAPAAPSTQAGGVTFELDEEANPEWYFSVDGIEPSDASDDEQLEVSAAIVEE